VAFTVTRFVMVELPLLMSKPPPPEVNSSDPPVIVMPCDELKPAALMPVEKVEVARSDSRIDADPTWKVPFTLRLPTKVEVPVLGPPTKMYPPTPSWVTGEVVPIPTLPSAEESMVRIGWTAVEVAMLQALMVRLGTVVVAKPPTRNTLEVVEAVSGVTEKSDVPPLDWRERRGTD
jgi:hypothetical protein